MSAPFVKWAGGKRKLASKIIAAMPAKFDRYIEPFVGGGAVFFALTEERLVGRKSFRKATLADSNAELMVTYEIVRASPHLLLRELRETKDFRNDEAAYYRVRALDPAKLSRTEVAARFLYLNRCCYNGLYRVNASGGFNVPFGKYSNPDIENRDAILAAHASLKEADVHLVASDFEVLLDGAGRGDVVYCDPPYIPLSASADFTTYTKAGFGPKEHKRLRDAIVRAVANGAMVIASNSNTPEARKLYRRLPGFRVATVTASRSVSCRADERSDVKELLIVGES